MIFFAFFPSKIGSKLKRSINVTYYSFLSRDPKENKFSKKIRSIDEKCFHFLRMTVVEKT